MALTITLKPDIEEALRQEAEQTGLRLEDLAAFRVEEAELVRQIRTLSAPPPAWRRYRRLLLRRRSGTITDQERAEMRAFSDESERRSALRLERLLRLAALWNASVPEAMVRLGIRAPRPL